MAITGKARFSVVIPLYNKNSGIRRAIATVLSNNSDLIKEIIVINDGSTDGSEIIVEEIARTNDKVRVIHQDNLGVSCARNAGIRRSSSDLIAFLDADDEWDPKFLTTIGQLSLDFPRAGVFATSYLWRWPTGGFSAPDLHNVPTSHTGGYLEDYVETIASGDDPLCASAVCVRKKVLESIGGFPEGIDYAEDKILWLRAALHGPIAWSPHVGCIYNKTLNSSSLKWTPERGTAFLSEIERCLEQTRDPRRLVKLRRLYTKELAHHGRRAAQARWVRTALGSAARVLIRCRPSWALQILISLLLPSRYYNYLKVVARSRFSQE